ncbi:hypothetical protein [Sanyastnella coralliicola]|uniref:hypothetical protein n=1 Tax=Sanyastnella coralliicola TaxID=3069118 RepID=UPI0027B8E26E|nr:hypothetical protein [Longitalea sp. SCSIO 12813]
MQSLVEARKYVESFARPIGYNAYSWNVAKRMALEAWDCYLTGRPFRKPINYFCREFYDMLKNPDGGYIVPEHKFKTY